MSECTLTLKFGWNISDYKILVVDATDGAYWGEEATDDAYCGEEATDDAYCGEDATYLCIFLYNLDYQHFCIICKKEHMTHQLAAW